MFKVSRPSKDDNKHQLYYIYIYIHVMYVVGYVGCGEILLGADWNMNGKNDFPISFGNGIIIPTGVVFFSPTRISQSSSHHKPF